MLQSLYKYYGQWTAIDLHKNHWIKNHIQELTVVCIVSRYSNKELKISLSKIFPQIGSKETGL